LHYSRVEAAAGAAGAARPEGKNARLDFRFFLEAVGVFLNTSG
jgi:hypothetical protein